jgi:hypothetical protein
MTTAISGKSVKSTKSKPLDIAGKWRMSGHSTEVGRFEWEAILILYRKRPQNSGTLEWRQTKGANAGAHRQGNWTFNGKTLALRWLTTHGTVEHPERQEPVHPEKLGISSKNLVAALQKRGLNLKELGIDPKKPVIDLKRLVLKLKKMQINPKDFGINPRKVFPPPLKRVQTVWTSSYVTPRFIKEGTYTVEYALPGVWEAEKIVSQTSPLLKGKWKMMGHSHLKEYWEAKLTLHARGGLEWKQVKGAITTGTRKGFWSYDGQTLKLDWYAPGGGQTEWLASTITGQAISNGRYTVDQGVPGDWWAEKLSPNCCSVKNKSPI